MCPSSSFADVKRGIGIPFDDVVIALPAHRLSSLSDLFRTLQPLCTPVRAIMDIGDIPVLRERLFQFGDLQMLDLANSPAESPMYFVLKRVFDAVFSLLVVLLASPLMLVIAAIVKITSKGPVLFCQERVGLNGQTFKMYKFRTMKSIPRQKARPAGRRPTIPVVLRWEGSCERPASMSYRNSSTFLKVR
jgi:hypothetical protein